MFQCPTCRHMHTEMRAVVNQDGSGRWLCPNCGHRYGIWLNEGALDIGIIADPGNLSIELPDDA